MDQQKLKSIIESILFVSGEPVKVSRIAKIAGVEISAVENAAVALSEEYGSGRGMVVVRKEDEMQLATAPENSGIISELIKSEIQEGLSKASLEVLSIIAYRGPMSRIDVEAIRGVNCSFTIRTLLMRGLIERVDNPRDSRSYLYKISFEFLKKMGLESVDRLPDFENLSRDPRIEAVISGQNPPLSDEAPAPREEIAVETN